MITLSALFWLAVEEPNLTYYIGVKASVCIYIYIHIQGLGLLDHSRFMENSMEKNMEMKWKQGEYSDLRFKELH